MGLRPALVALLAAAGPVLLAPPASAAPLSTVPPSITGTAEYAATLTAQPGAWTPAPTAYSYRWLRDGQPIAKAPRSWRLRENLERTGCGCPPGSNINAAHHIVEKGDTTPNGIAALQCLENAGVDVDWAVSRRFGRQVIEAIRSRAVRGSWFNVNFPHCAPDKVSGIRAVPSQRFARSPMRYYASENPGKFFVAIPDQPTPVDPSNDMFELVHSNAITVTPMLLQSSDVAFAAELDGQLTL